jgi:hypothetical protein
MVVAVDVSLKLGIQLFCGATYFCLEVTGKDEYFLLRE